MTKHSAMYPRARQGGDAAAADAAKKEGSRNVALNSPMMNKDGIDITDSANLGFAPSVGGNTGCQCDERAHDEEEKENMMAEVHITYERILQLEQALIELDEQNTTNTLEIRKREAKMVFIIKQIEEIDEILNTNDSEDAITESTASMPQLNQLREQKNLMTKQVTQHRQQIDILNESTKANMEKRQSMKQNLYEHYQQIKNIRDSISTDRIKLQDNKDFLELVVKNNFLESQNV